MKGVLKWFAAVVGVVVVLLVAAVILLPLLVDPNDHKQALVEQVKERTGRDLRIEGDIELSVFPWIGIELGKVALSNAAGFTNPVFASSQQVSIHVKLLPLLSKRLEMDTVTVRGLRLNLARDAKGRSNWDDLIAAASSDQSASSGTSDASEGRTAVALAIGGLDVRDANLSWDDASQGQRFEISNLSIKSGAIIAGEPVELELALDVQMAEPAISGRIAAEAKLDYDDARKIARLSDFEIQGAFSGEQLPGGEARITLAADVVHDAGEKSVLVENLRLEAEGLELTGELRVNDIDTAPSTEGSIRIDSFDAKKLIDSFSKDGLQTSDPKALTRVSLQATLGGKPNQLIVKPLTIRFDDSTLTGELTMPDIKSQALRFDLDLDAIDVDRYLPPESGTTDASSQAPATPGAAASGASELPMEALRKLNVIGQMKIGKLKAANLNLTDVDVSIKAKDGLIRLKPIVANLYNGRYRGNIRVNAKGKSLRTVVDENLTGVLAGPLLKDLQGAEPITGAVNVMVALKTKGTTPDEVKKSLKGSARFEFTDGAINGVNIARMIREAYARIKGIQLPPAEAEQRTDFSALRGSLNIKNGTATNNDFTVMTPLLRINGRGTADILAETVDYRIKATIVKTLEGQGGEELKDLVGIPIPIHVTGSFAEPKYALDSEALAEALAKSEVQNLIDDKVGDDGIKGLLKNLLK